MTFYELSLAKPPRFFFAHRVDLKKYANRFEKTPFFEISFLEEGDILFTNRQGEKSIAKAGSLVPIFPDLVCTAVAYREQRQRHSTVAIHADRPFSRFEGEIDAFTFNAIKKRVTAGESALIPFREPMGERAPEILRRLKRLIAFLHSDSASDTLRAVGEWYALLALLSEFVLKKIDDSNLSVSPSEELYARQAAQYLREKYHENVNVGEIAKHLGLSVGYLHRVFKAVYGYGPIEYRNRYRVHMAISIIKDKGISLAEAGELVGINDPAYMSRLFKKIMGISARQYYRDKEIKASLHLY